MANFATKRAGILLCAFAILSPLCLFAHSFETEELHKDPQWHTLLHFRNGASEVDDPKFFLSPTGKKDPKAELLATIDALRNDPSDDEDSYACRFPARAWFLQKSGVEIPPKKCEKLNRTIREIDPQKLILSFPTAHINSPASMFGHTLLRIDGSNDTSLTSHAINYAAFTDERNGFIFAFKGIFGFFEGHYSVVPYYKKIHEYNGTENRDIWEYELDFTPAETAKALLYAIETSHFYSDYFFFSENCSYNILWILQFAKDSRFDLVSDFHITATPIDTIRTLQKHGLIKNSLYRHSKMKLVNTIFDSLQDKNLAKNFIRDHYPMDSLRENSESEKTKILDIASNDLLIKFIQHKIDKESYTRDFIRILKERSKLPKLDYTPKEPFDPLRSDLSNRISLGISKHLISLSYRPAYHDIYDIERGFISGAYITFFDFEARHDKRRNESFLHKASILDIRSYAAQTFYHKPISWEVRLEGIRLEENKFYTRLKAGAGVTLGNEAILAYFMPQGSVAIGEDSLWGISPKVGFNINYFENFKIGAFCERNFYFHKSSNNVAEGYITAYINRAFNLMLKVAKEESSAQEEYWFNVNYKF
ncbi:MAG: Lnb N-terminal periplasmic domain-containing protein [Wolinella sp.]